MPVSNEWLLATAKDLWGDCAWVHVSQVPKGGRHPGTWCACAYAGTGTVLTCVSADYQPTKELASRMLLAALQVALVAQLKQAQKPEVG